MLCRRQRAPEVQELGQHRDRWLVTDLPELVNGPSYAVAVRVIRDYRIQVFH